MDTRTNRGTLVAEYLNTAAVIAILLALILTWRTLVGQDNGVVNLISRLF